MKFLQKFTRKMLRRATKRSKTSEKQDRSKVEEKTKRSRKVKTVLGTKTRKDEAEKVLEQLVIGDDHELVDKLEDTFTQKKVNWHSGTELGVYVTFYVGLALVPGTGYIVLFNLIYNVCQSHLNCDTIDVCHPFSCCRYMSVQCCLVFILTDTGVGNLLPNP